MSTIVVLSGSPSAVSRTAALCAHVSDRLRRAGHEVAALRARDLPARALLAADTGHPRIAEAVRLVEEADGVVVASPVYKAAYSGLLKALLDLLPQFAFAGKVVLPLVTGGSPAHVLAIDYALRPVLTSLGADHVVPGWFVLDRHITIDGGEVALDPEHAAPLHRVVDAFASAVDARRPLLAAS
ncbi:FMN reductase (NADPH) [Microbispora rosea subsp. aerata]|nr:NADPH-dependent FMN reductase [Microbispora rosea]GGO23669.1 FMN reductase (NADPH) [Microbispora rosea subsp. aerata]GIH57800.1 FMN reductase (NADPH) [Microbispora rosea subsp. aerata]GLJ84482.1 FMN reductase (NADPH) [Microbispora rosea subsp. aerata]